MENTEDQIEPAETQQTSVNVAERVIQEIPLPEVPAIETDQDIKKKKKKPRKKGCLIFLGILVLIGIASVIAFPKIVKSIVLKNHVAFEVTDEKVDELAPVDPNLSLAVDQSEPYPDGETWAIYMYLVGADLESRGNNDLSPMTRLLVQDESERIFSAEIEKTKTQIKDFVEEVRNQGIDLPNYFFKATDNKEIEYDPGNPNPDAEGFASANLKQLYNVNLPENIKFVIQTGGANHWQDARINPNRTQRFIYDSNGMKLVQDLPLQNMASVDTLTEFLSWCIEEHPADHKMVLFWNHGGGISGYGMDEIFGSILSITDIHDAFENALGAHAYDEIPYFDIIGFDACLMASVEVAHELYPFAKYLYASEETEPGSGWNYEEWAGALAENRTINAMQLGKIVTDSYIKSALSVASEYGIVMASTFSIVDLAKAEEVYQAYIEFIEAVLNKTSEDRTVFGDVTKAAAASIFYASTAYRVYNTIDLGLFMDNISPVFPEEASKVRDALNRSVIYMRNTSHLADSQGLSVYFPARLSGMGGLKMMLDYLNNDCDSDAIAALYYYKVAGCLSDDLQDKLSRMGIGELPTLDLSPMQNLGELKVTFNDEQSFSMQYNQVLEDLTQSAWLELVYLDEKEETFTYYGDDFLVSYDNEKKVLNTTFNGQWVMLDNAPLFLEIIDANEEQIRYRSKVNYNLQDGYLLLTYDKQTGDMSLLGVSTDAQNVVGRNPDMVAKNDIIVPIYQSNKTSSSSVKNIEGAPIIYDPETTVLRKSGLKDGTYLLTLEFEDLRADTYYGPIIRVTVKDGKVTESKLDEDFFTYDREL